MVASYTCDMAERDRRRAIEGRWLPEPVTWSMDVDVTDKRATVEGWRVGGSFWRDGKWHDMKSLFNLEEDGMSIYQVFFVNKENKSLSWEYVVTDSRDAAVIKAFAEAKLENIDDYHIEVKHCHSLYNILR